MKKEYLFLVLVLAMFLVGCSQTGTQTTETQSKTNTAASSKVGLDKIYKYGQLKSYEYKLTSEGTDSVNMKYTISSDSVASVAAWLQKSEITTEGGTIVSNFWMDKITYKCLKINSVMNFGGQEIIQDGQCPPEGPSSVATNKVPEIDYLGKETVTVPAGTFNCEKYSYEGGYYWSNANVPIPVKTSMSDGKVIMELVSYS